MTNKLLVQGVLNVVGVVNDLKDNGTGAIGLGWVDYPDRGKALVKKICYNFQEGMTAELELTREEFHYGEVPLKYADMQNDIHKDLLKYKRLFASKTFTAGNDGSSIPALNFHSDSGPADMFDRG